MDWMVYIIECDDGSFYTGITTDIERRFQQHQTGKGAKYFRRCAPLRVVFVEAGHDRRSASQKEILIKSMSHKEKQLLFLESS